MFSENFNLIMQTLCSTKWKFMISVVSQSVH
uniref:ASL1/Skint5 fusion protein n=1 Tax=Mus musculus TaxID=10090 RepID=C6EQI1_MOUSE|nr:ASL1/Skint5 fusion protein [Mus musculus]